MSLAALEILEQAQFPPAQARVIARVLEAESVARREDLATKADLAELRQASKAELAEFQQATKAGLADLRHDFSELRHATQADIAELRQATSADINRLEVKIESAKAEGIRFTFLAMVGQVAMLAGVMYFLLQNAAR
jgi:ribosomal protein L29